MRLRMRYSDPTIAFATSHGYSKYSFLIMSLWLSIVLAYPITIMITKAIRRLFPTKKLCEESGFVNTRILPLEFFYDNDKLFNSEFIKRAVQENLSVFFHGNEELLKVYQEFISNYCEIVKLAVGESNPQCIKRSDFGRATGIYFRASIDYKNGKPGTFTTKVSSSQSHELLLTIINKLQVIDDVAVAKWDEALENTNTQKLVESNLHRTTTYKPHIDEAIERVKNLKAS